MDDDKPAKGIETRRKAAKTTKRQLAAKQTLKEATVGNLRVFGCYLEGDSSQGEGLEVSLLPLQRTQHEAFLTGADVVVSVAVERPHTGREPRGKTRSRIKGLQTQNELNTGSTSPPTLAVTCVYAPSAERNSPCCRTCTRPSRQWPR